MDKNLPDWEIGKLYNQAWNIIKKYKVLWLFGLASGAGISLNYNFGGQGINSETIKNFQKFLDNAPQEQASNVLAQVLGASTSQGGETLANIFSSVPLFFYLILGIEIIFVTLLFIIIGFIFKAWSQAALLEGIQTSLSNGVVTIRETSEKAMSSIKPLIWLQIVPMFIVIAAFLGIFILTVLLFAIPIVIAKVILGAILLISVIVIIYCFIYLIFSQVWAPRIAVIEKASGKDSLFRGYRIAKKKKWSMILLGLVNIIMSFFIMAVPILLVIGIVFGGIIFAERNETLGIGLFAIGAILIIPMIIAMTLVGGILNAFKATVWSIAYNNIRGKYDGK